MCTATLRLDDGGLLLAMNRDERRERAPESPPILREEPDGPAWIAPADGAAGGTWIGVNDRGLVACLLNNYDAANPDVDPSTAPSRGGIVPELMRQGTAEDARYWLEHDLDPTPYAPFTLVVANADAASRHAWSGHGEVGASPLPRPWAMLTSSSWNGPEVCDWRRERFGLWLAKGSPFAGDLPAYNRWRPRRMDAWSPLMAREASATRSVTLVEIDAERSRASLRYWPDAQALALDPRAEAEPRGVVAEASPGVTTLTLDLKQPSGQSKPRNA